MITEIGPDIPEISRRLGQFKESVRYRYKAKLLDKGFTVQAAVAYEKLGLQRVMFLAEFNSDYKQYANTMLTAMNELCYVVYFAKTIPDGSYIVDAAVPSEFVEPFSRFLFALKQKGLFSHIDVFTFDQARNPQMQSALYDFDHGRWDFDWSKALPRGNESTAYQSIQPEKFDKVDLLILKELQIDATRSLTEISAKLGINYKKLAWHHTTHVVDRQLVRSYRLNWMGTRYDFRLEKALHRKHRYMSLVIVVKDTTYLERAALMSKTSHLPFLWFEAWGKNYYADLEIPIDLTTEALAYLESALEPVKDRARYHFLDSSNSLTFTMTYQLYDQNEKRWTFNAPELLSKFDNLLMRIKE